MGLWRMGSTSFLQRGKLFPKGDSISCIDEAEKSRTEKLGIQFGNMDISRTLRREDLLVVPFCRFNKLRLDIQVN